MTNKSHYLLYLTITEKQDAILCCASRNSSAIFNISLQLNFHAATKYAITKYFIELAYCTIYNNIQAE